MATGAIDANGQVAKLFAAYDGDVDVSKLDFESAVAVVLTNRTEALDQVLNGQLADMNQRNAQIKALNKLNEMIRTSKDGSAIGDYNAANAKGSGETKTVTFNGQSVKYKAGDLYDQIKD